MDIHSANRQESTTGNSRLASCGVTCLNSNEVLLLGFTGKLTVKRSEIPHERQAAKRYRKPYDDTANINQTDMKQTIFDTITDRLTSKPTSQRFVFNFFCQHINFLIQFFANAQNTLSFFCPPQKTQRKKNERVFSPMLKFVQR
jgi:hypothetical protein